MVKKKVLLLLACVVLWPVLSFGADANAVKDLFAQAHKFAQDDDYNGAETVYKQISAENPGTDYDFNAKILLTMHYIRRDKKILTDAAYESLINDFADHPDLPRKLHEEIGYTLRENRVVGRPDKARQIYQYMKQRWPQRGLSCQAGIIQCYMKEGDWENTSTAIDELLRDYADSDLSTAIYDLAYQYRSHKKWEKSRDLYKYALSQWPQHNQATKAMRYAIKADIKLGNNAGKQIENLIAANANNEKIGYEIGELAGDYAQTGNYEKAASLYALVAQRWPQSEWAPWAQCQSARMYIEIGDYTNAAEVVEKLKTELSTSPGIVNALEDVGDKYELNYSSREAYDIYKYLLQNWPTDSHAITIQMKAILSQIRLRDLDKANAELSNLLDNFTGNKKLAPMVHEVVEEYRDAGYNEEGRTLFKYILENWTQDESTNLELQTGLALQSIKLGELAKAQTATDNLIADYNDHPNIAKALFQIAEEYFYAEKYNEASALWELLETDYPSIKFKTRDEILYVLGVCYQRMEKYDTSIEYYQEFIQKHPNHRFMADAPYVVGMIYYRHKKDYEKALYWLDYQVKFYPKKLGQNVLFNQCVIYTHNIQEYNKGIEVCGQCVRDYPKGQRLWGCLSNLALCYERIGNIEKAKETLQKAYEVSSSENLRNHVSERISRLEAGGAQ